ncbi:PD40 domain-containing protein [Flagellimonas allohymeniacidonis]|nr:PD40 domain-containing protein [Allomuricauda hymeniacidonis]
MKKPSIYFLIFFFVAIYSDAQEFVFEPNTISVPEKTTHEISFTQDGQTLYFTQTVDSKWQKSQLGFKSYFADGVWGKPIKIEFVDSLYNMSVSPDGNRALFCKEDKTWLCLKEKGKWSIPKDLNSDYGYSFNGGYYHILNDNSFYFSGVQENELHPYDDIYYVAFRHGRYQKPKRLNQNINTEATEFSPWVNKRNSMMIFTRYDASSNENTGIFVSRFEDNKWQKAQKIDALEYGWGVFVREDKRTLYYSVGGAIYAYDLKSLDININ